VEVIDLAGGIGVGKGVTAGLAERHKCEKGKGSLPKNCAGQLTVALARWALLVKLTWTGFTGLMPERPVKAHPISEWPTNRPEQKTLGPPRRVVLLIASEVFDLKPTSVESRDSVESRLCRAFRNC
jgi:hypothetical protein